MRYPYILLGFILFLSLNAYCQQLGTDSLTVVNGTTTLDISKSIPVGFIVAGAVIFQALAVSYVLINLSHDPPKKDEKPAEKPSSTTTTTTESPALETEEPYFVYNQDDTIPYELEEENIPYDPSLPLDDPIEFEGEDVEAESVTEKEKVKDASEENQPEEPLEPEEDASFGDEENLESENSYQEVPTYNELYYQDVKNQYAGYQAYPDQEYNAVNYQYTNNGYQTSNGNNYQYFHSSKPSTFYRRHKRTVEENNLVDTLHKTEQFECHSRLICSMASGQLGPSKFDPLMNFFTKKSKFDPNEVGFKYMVAAKVGRSSRSIKICEQRYRCPLASSEFNQLLQTEM